MDKLYVITRADLPPGDQAVQSVHAAIQYTAEHKDWTDWFETSNHLALLSVANEAELHSLLRKAADRGLKLASFREPNFDNAMTAIALEPGFRSRRLCSKLRKTLSEVEDVPA